MSAPGETTKPNDGDANTMQINNTFSMDSGDRYVPTNSHKRLNHIPGYDPYLMHRPSTRQPHHTDFHGTRPPSHQLQTVVTNSFSEERDDAFGRAAAAATNSAHRYAYGSTYKSDPLVNYHTLDEDRHPSESRSRVIINERQGTEGREEIRGAPVPPSPHRETRAPPPIMIPPSPQVANARGEREDTLPPAPHTLPPPSDKLKRSFWHHSCPGDASSYTMHPAFAPPKRSKAGMPPKKKEVTIAPKVCQDEGVFSRSMSLGNNERNLIHQSDRSVTQSLSFSSSQSWTGSPVATSQQFRGYLPGTEQNYNKTGQPSPKSAFRGDPTSAGVPWQPPYGAGWGPPNSTSPTFMRPRSESMSWSDPTSPRPPNYQEMQRMTLREVRDDEPTRRQDTPGDKGAPNAFRPYYRYDANTSGSILDKTPPPQNKSDSGEKIAVSVSGHMKPSESKRSSGGNLSSVQDRPMRLLAQPEDRISLSETLCTIRENIEVFTATQTDVDAPAPGRKHAVVVGQVGLRCVYCRHTTNYSDRVKRAVCYPSSIKRIYRTIIDMKLDHFQHCQFVPSTLRDRLNELKANNTRSTGTTMQYFVRAAKKMGMIDGPSGIRLCQPPSEYVQISPSKQDTSLSPTGSPKSPKSALEDSEVANESQLMSPASGLVLSISRDGAIGRSASEESTPIVDDGAENVDMAEFTGKVVLALPEDKTALSPLRCFLRENVCAFSASEEDIAVRTPTTFSVRTGQVGIGCIHCHSLPAKERSNRAVCFPFSIGRIYQSVADIQRFHLTECKLVPPEVRKKFQILQSQSSKGSKGLATRQYWVTSARKIGLIDTPRGIRFCRDPLVPTTPAVSLDILAQVASNATTVNRNLVVPEDKAHIAEFLYVVMDQLQPCRFTEADRNKRRLKDVGCFGVECKHCAGKVESRKFFWSSVNAVESNFVSVHTHMMECKMVPQELKDRLAELKKLRKEQTAQLKIGSQKAFFRRVWTRLHGQEAATPTAQAAATVRSNAQVKAPSVEVGGDATVTTVSV